MATANIIARDALSDFFAGRFNRSVPAAADHIGTSSAHPNKNAHARCSQPVSYICSPLKPEGIDSRRVRPDGFEREVRCFVGQTNLIAGSPQIVDGEIVQSAFRV